MYQQRFGARAEYRQQEGQRVKDSASLAEKFQQLKSMRVDLRYQAEESEAQSKEVKFEVNLQNARSVFRFDCPNAECIRGDFDLTKEVAAAVGSHRNTVSGKVTCPGWRSRTTIDTVHCGYVLNYKLSLKY